MQQVMHNWPKDPHQPTEVHQLRGGDEADCWCDPKVMEFVPEAEPGHRWMTVRAGSRH